MLDNAWHGALNHCTCEKEAMRKTERTRKMDCMSIENETEESSTLKQTSRGEIVGGARSMTHNDYNLL